MPDMNESTCPACGEDFEHLFNWADDIKCPKCGVSLELELTGDTQTGFGELVIGEATNA